MDNEPPFHQLREHNMQELRHFLHQDQTVKKVNTFNKNDEPKQKLKSAKHKDEDENFQFFGRIPSERRKSARLSNQSPQYSYADLKDENVKVFSGDDLETLEDVVYEPKKRRTFKVKRYTSIIVKSPEEITQSDIDNIAKSLSKKVRDVNGTSCQQCRQKTLDMKTICRSGRCVGIHGQLCGPCLRIRYGEDAAVALKDPNWNCPFCRNFCNCSICRNRAGKRPTGILAPMAFKLGFKCVTDFLEDLKGLGDYKENSRVAEETMVSNRKLALPVKVYKKVPIKLDDREEAVEKFVPTSPLKNEIGFDKDLLGFYEKEFAVLTE